MSRVIKFRCWDNSLRQMANGKGMLNVTVNILNDGSINFPENGWYELMQFTGLTDKNGKEIYEGDIVTGYGFGEHPDGKSSKHENGQVMFDKYVTDNEQNEDMLGWTFMCELRRHALDPQFTWEVVGNIYENPELITHTEPNL